MKKVLAIFLLAIMTVTLSACGKDNEDKLQGKWKANTTSTIDSIGTEITFKEGNIYPKGSEDALMNLKSYTFKDKDKTIIRLYEERADDKIYDKDYPSVYGVIKFKDNKHISIDTNDDGKYNLEKTD